MFVPYVNLPEGASTRDSRWIVFDGRQQVLLIDGALPTGPSSPVPAVTAHVLGTDDDTPVWVVDGGKYPEVEEESAEWVNLRSLYGRLSDADWTLAGRGAQVLLWDRDHQFCGRCGTATQPHDTDRARHCGSCGLLSFPRISPAVIMLVERTAPGGVPEVLLAWGRQFPGRFFSALAGFVEPGESLEECVVREIREEVGIEVSDVTYFASPPWPFPHSLMVGFTARYVSGDITVQEAEIVEAGWFSANELPPAPRGGMSIAGWLIEDWLNRTAN
ncbi:MAG: NAD(+) diphosphatase [Acidimicrobiales bacterium]